jgi:hypothetical protein
MALTKALGGGGGGGITQLTGDVTAGPGSGSQAATLAAGAVDIAHHSATGTPSSSTFLRGDNAWAAPSGGGAVAPTVLQSAYLRGNAAGSIALASAPTLGSVMLLIMTGATGGAAPPTGWTALAPSGSGGASFQKAWAAVKSVKAGETGSVSVTASDWHNLALFEFDDLNYFGYSIGRPGTSGSTYTIPFLPQLIVGVPMLFVGVEHDSGITLAVTEAGFTTLQTYGASSNHWAVLANRSTAFAGEIVGTSASTFNDPIYIAVAVGK